MVDANGNLDNHLICTDENNNPIVQNVQTVILLAKEVADDTKEGEDREEKLKEFYRKMARTGYIKEKLLQALIDCKMDYGELYDTIMKADAAQNGNPISS